MGWDPFEDFVAEARSERAAEQRRQRRNIEISLTGPESWRSALARAAESRAAVRVTAGLRTWTLLPTAVGEDFVFGSAADNDLVIRFAAIDLLETSEHLLRGASDEFSTTEGPRSFLGDVACELAERNVEVVAHFLSPARPISGRVKGYAEPFLILATAGMRSSETHKERGLINLSRLAALVLSAGALKVQ